MGLIAAALGAASSTLADQYKEYFYCPSMSTDILMTKGQKREQKKSVNHGSDNLISNGSVIAVNDGQCMILVDQGKVTEVCAQAGAFTYDSSSEPSIFTDGLAAGIKESFKQFGRRVGFGGDTGTDQRVYFINTKDIIGNKYGTVNPIPFRLIDNNIGMDMDLSLRCHGEYAYKIVDPVLFYTNIAGNVSGDYTRSQIESQLRTELLTALQPALGKISAMGIRYSELPLHADDIAAALNEVLSAKWGKLYGIEISSFGVSSATISEEDEKMIKEMQKSKVYSNVGMAAGNLAQAQAQAMQDAAKNTATGPMMAFAGMNMAQQAGGMNLNQMFGAAQAQQPQMQPQAAGNQWTCSCGTVNNGKFCSNCGSPAPAASWTCSCGTVNNGKFCSNCGSPRP